MKSFTYPNVPSGEPSTFGKTNREIIEGTEADEAMEAPAEEAAEKDESATVSIPGAGY